MTTLIRPQVRTIPLIATITRLTAGQETAYYLVSVTLGRYCESGRVMEVSTDSGSDYYCNCDEWKANVPRGFYTCLHVTAVRMSNQINSN